MLLSEFGLGADIVAVAGVTIGVQDAGVIFD